MGEISSSSVTLSLDRSGDQGSGGIGTGQNSSWGIVCKKVKSVSNYGPCMQQVHTLAYPVSSSLSSKGNAWLHMFRLFHLQYAKRSDAFRLNSLIASLLRLPDRDGKWPKRLKRLRTRGSIW